LVDSLGIKRAFDRIATYRFVIKWRGSVNGL